MKLFEIFDSVYDAVIEYDDSGASAKFTTDDGSTVHVDWAEYRGYAASIKGNVLMLEFARNGSVDITGKGDALKIFSTVASLTKEVLNKEQPGALVFLADKGSQSRVSLYKRFLQRFKHPMYRSVTDPTQIQNLHLRDWLDQKISDWQHENEFLVLVHKVVL